MATAGSLRMLASRAVRGAGSRSGAVRGRCGRTQAMGTAGRLRRLSAWTRATATEEATAVEKAYGFTRVRDEDVTEYNARALLLRHEKTGAEVMSVHNDDENKTFGIAFRTPPQDNKGVPHILEHSVMNGSRKYPVKEPFVELIKGSLNTFINAMTFPDRTCYPVASTNTQDFYNLMDVYLDSVFFPKCVEDEQTFMQEGWHYELEQPSDQPSLNGVVFNEMKGVYSNPDSVIGRAIQTELFPDNAYGVDSGGDPMKIPDLSYEEFKDFHARYYHPSNARIWVYGDDPLEERLKRLGQYLNEFDMRSTEDSKIGVQPLFSEPKRVTKSYGASENETKHYLTINWVLAEDSFDTERRLEMEFLNHLLLGTPAAPLRKALEESGLGEEMVGGGLEDELRQPMFSVGLKGVPQERVPEVESLVYQTLERCAKEGFNEDELNSTANTIEFTLRENNTGRLPRGLAMMFTSMVDWLYERDPFAPLRWEGPLNNIKERMRSEQNLFGPLISKYLLNNSHRVTLEMKPDPELGSRMNEEERRRLEEKRVNMSSDEAEQMVRATKELKARQETPEDPEKLKCVPSLSLEDLPREPKSVPTEVSDTKGAETLAHDLFTNNILYADLLLDLRPVPSRLLPLVPLFCRSLTRMGTAKEDFVGLQHRIGANTGGISFSPFASDIKGSDNVACYVACRGKATEEKAGELFGLFEDILHTAPLNDKEVFKQLVLESKSSMERQVVAAGHRMAASRLDAQRTLAGWANEQFSGLSQLEFLRSLVDRVDSDWEGVKGELEELRKCLLASRQSAVLNLTGDAKCIERGHREAESLVEGLEKGEKEWQWKNEAMLPKENEALVVPTQVNYVGKAANLYEEANYDLQGQALVVNKHLGMSYLWDKVRVSGGAYGAFSDFDTHSGVFTYLSFRDPNFSQTLANYDGAGEFLRGVELDRDALTKAIVGTIGDLDAHQLPDAKGYSALMRHLLGITDDERQRRRDQVLSTTASDFRAFADLLDVVRSKGTVSAVASETAASQCSSSRPEMSLVTRKVL